MKVYNSFIDLFEQSIKPLIKENPKWIRLDGELKGGNRQVFGKFKFNNKVWKINSDTHIDKLKIAYQSFKDGEEPFIENHTDKNRLLTLELKNNKGFKYLYIYKSK